MLNQRLRVYSQELYREKSKTPFWEEPSQQAPLQGQQLNTLKTDTEERYLYENCKESQEGKTSIKDSIELVIVLTEQNDKLTQKIAEIMDQLETEQHKGAQYEQKIKQNNRQIASLQQSLEMIRSEKKEHYKLENLNQSEIPNHSAQLSTTHNNQSWLNEFLSKEDLQQLWTHRREQTIKAIHPKKAVKKYTLDLKAAVDEQRLKKNSEKHTNSCNVRADSSQRLRKVDRSSKKTINSVAYKSREAEKRYDLKVDLNDKQRKMAELWEKTRGKPLSYMRGAKKVKNPEL